MSASGTVNFSNTSFSVINNKTQKLDIFSTQDTSWNVMTFTIQNSTGVDLALTGGTPVNTAQTGGTSSFLFDFRTILTDPEASAMGVKDSLGQWGAKYFPPSGHDNPSWAVAPLKDLTLKNGDKVIFTLEDIACSSQSPGRFDLMYFNISGMMDRTFSYLVAVLNPPEGKDLKTVLDMGILNQSVIHVIGNQNPPPPASDGPPPVPVLITYDNSFLIQNGFTLYLKNNSGNPLVPQGTGLGKAVITISFLFATDDDDAITTQKLGDNIVIAVDPQKSQWSTTNEHQANTGNWFLTPKSPELMFANEQVNFIISNLITDLNVNPQTLSSMHVQWNFIPGYADGYCSIELQKQLAKPSIPSFTIEPTTINLGENVKISYQTEVAAYVMLEYGLRDGTPVTLVSPTDITYNEVNLQPPTPPDKEATLFTLSVYCAPGQPVQNQKTFPITVNQPPAVIDFFKASSMLVDINGDNSVMLSWQVENAKTVFVPNFGPQTGNSLSVKVTATTTYTLQVTPWGTNGQVIQATVTIYAYQSFPSLPVGIMGDGTAFQVLPLSITNRAKGVIYISNSAAHQVYQVIQANHQVSPTVFSGNIMALTPDGQKLFVAEADIPLPAEPVITMYDTTNPLSSFPVKEPGPPPYSMAISPDGTILYYLQRHGLITVSAFSVNEAANTFAYGTDIPVGTSPQAYAFDGTGENLYIGNYDSASISVIHLADNTVKTIDLKPKSNDLTEPCAFALVGTILFVACSGSNLVGVIDTSTNTVLDPITAGNRPFSLTLDQNKARLFVTNFQDKSVTVIDTATRTVTAILNVGNGPSAAKITDSGNLMFVSNYCDKSLTVVDISNGGTIVVGTITLESTNGNPIDVSTYPTNNFYTDVFVAKEYFRGRNDSCPSPTATDANLNMSIFSIQEKSISANVNPQLEMFQAGPKSKRNGILGWLSWLTDWVRQVLERILE